MQIQDIQDNFGHLKLILSAYVSHYIQAQTLALLQKTVTLAKFFPNLKFKGSLHSIIDGQQGKNVSEKIITCNVP